MARLTYFHQKLTPVPLESALGRGNNFMTSLYKGYVSGWGSNLQLLGHATDCAKSAQEWIHDFSERGSDFAEWGSI